MINAMNRGYALFYPTGAMNLMYFAYTRSHCIRAIEKGYGVEWSRLYDAGCRVEKIVAMKDQQMTHETELRNAQSRADKDCILKRVRETMTYFQEEFAKDPSYPTYNHNVRVWEQPVSSYAGGVTPDDLVVIEELLLEMPRWKARAIAAENGHPQVAEIKESMQRWIDHHSTRADKAEELLRELADALRRRNYSMSAKAFEVADKALTKYEQYMKERGE